jgi:hypothetical protein
VDSERGGAIDMDMETEAQLDGGQDYEDDYGDEGS